MPAPTIASVTVVSPSPVPQYGLLEAQIALTTQSSYPMLPYDPIAPAYAANLKASEDARGGVSVDALLTAPNGSTITWSCYWGQDFDTNGNALGTSGWRLRFAPAQVGVWSLSIRVTDAGGTMTSPPQAFTCAASASKGFLRVSPTDSRYFEYSDGTPFIATGGNTEPQDLGRSLMDAVAAAGGVGLWRIWTSTQGLGVVGGRTQNAFTQGGIALYSGCVTPEDARTGRYCLSIPVPSGFGPQIVLSNLPANTMLTLTAFLKGVGESGPPALWTSVGVCASVGGPDAHGWQQVSVSFSSGAGGRLQIGLGDYGSTSGHLLVDDIAITNPAGGDLLGGAGSFEGHTSYCQVAASELDQICQYAQDRGQVLKLVWLNKFDQCFGSLNTDGTALSNAAWLGLTSLQQAEASLGGSTNPNADTPCQRAQRHYARYVAARWLAYVSVHSSEHVNEMEYANGIEYAGSQAWSQALRAFSRDGTTQGRIPCTSSTAANGSGLTYDVGFYENKGQYPDIDHADYHWYPDPSDATHGNGLPYDDVGNLYNCRGSQRFAGGGPNGLGRLRFALATQALGDPNNLQALWPLPTLRGQGTWTLSYWLRADTGAQFSAAPNAQIHLSALPGGYMQSPAGGGVASPSATWQQYSNTFTLGDNLPHQGGWLNLYACLAQSTPAGTGVEFADVRLTAPNGRAYWRITFDEPSWLTDGASIAAYFAGGKASYSGDPAIGGPFVVGEVDQFSLPTAGLATMARRAAFAAADASATTLVWWSGMAYKFLASGCYAYFGRAQRWLAGTHLSSGLWRRLDPVIVPPGGLVQIASTPPALLSARPFAAYGQSDGTHARVALFPRAAGAVDGDVLIPGLAPGQYTITRFNTETGETYPAFTEAAPTPGYTGLALRLRGIVNGAVLTINPAADGMVGGL